MLIGRALGQASELSVIEVRVFHHGCWGSEGRGEGSVRCGASSDVSFGEHFSLECLYKILEPGWASRVGISAGSCQHFAADRKSVV